MAMAIQPLKDLVEDEPKTYTLPLVKNMDPNDEANAKKRGEITFEMTFKPFKEVSYSFFLISVLKFYFVECELTFVMAAPLLQEDNISTAEELDGTQRAPDGTSPNGGLLSVRIHSAEELEGKHHTNPYVEVHFRGEKQKTAVSDRRLCLQMPLMKVLCSLLFGSRFSPSKMIPTGVSCFFLRPDFSFTVRKLMLKCSQERVMAPFVSISS